MLGTLCISKNRDRKGVAASIGTGVSQLGVGITHGMDFAGEDELWKKTMQFVCFNPLNSHLGQP